MARFDLDFFSLTHDPLVAFVALFVLSLVAAYILFKLLDSRATIKRKEWSAGGAIAGFLLILFGSWWAIRPAMSAIKPVVPLFVPNGFKSESVSAAGLAIAIPQEWERKDSPLILMFAPKVPDESNPTYMLIQVSACTKLPEMTSSEELAKVQKEIKETFGGFVSLRGPSSNDPYIGHKGSMDPIRITIPGEVLEPPRSKDVTLDMIVRNIFDERNNRCMILEYSDNELGRQMSSTLNIANPQQ